MWYYLILVLAFHQELRIPIFIIKMHRWAHISSKNTDIFPTLPSINKNFERESNPMPESLYLYLSRYAFLFSFVDPNKQLFNAKYVFKFLNHGFSM